MKVFNDKKGNYNEKKKFFSRKNISGGTKNHPIHTTNQMQPRNQTPEPKSS
jgi:hypothetical protein